MTAVNIIVENLHIHKGLMLDGEIKKYPMDFHVRELHSHSIKIPAGQVNYKFTHKDQNDKQRCADDICHDDIESGHGVNYLEEIIGPEVVLMISDANDGFKSKLQSIRKGEMLMKIPSPNRVAALLPDSMSKIQRGLLHSIIKDLFPFLVTATMSAADCREQFTHPSLYTPCNESIYSDDGINVDIPQETDNINLIDDGDAQIRVVDGATAIRNIPEIAIDTTNVNGIWISADHSLIELAETAITLPDIGSVYAFKGRGPHHKDAKEGVRVGLGLSRDERTKVYRIITSNCMSLDSKTANDCSVKRRKQNHRQDTESHSVGPVAVDSKSMIIFWKKKATAGKGKRGIDVDDACDSSLDELHLGFLLCKYNTEHLTAMQQVASAVGAAVSDISFCGIKDKKALTYQRCVLAVRDTNRVNLDEGHLSGASPTCIHECLNVVSSGSLKERAAGIITTLLNQFPDKDLHPSDGSEVQSVANCERGSVSVSGIYLALRPLKIGELWGNWFNIIIRNVRAASEDSGPDSSQKAESLCASFQDAVNNTAITGFPNFFGSQRMGYQDQDRNVKEHEGSCGTSMPLGPSIGKLLLLGRYSEAISVIILGSSVYKSLKDNSLSGLQGARDLFARGASIVSVLNLMPRTAIKERMLLKAMVRFGWIARAYRKSTFEVFTNGNNSDSHSNGQQEDVAISVRVLGQIPYSTRSLWVSAYQSWIWNRVASHRLITSSYDSNSHSSVSDVLCEQVGTNLTPLTPVPLATEGDLVYISAIASNESKQITDDVAKKSVITSGSSSCVSIDSNFISASNEPTSLDTEYVTVAAVAGSVGSPMTSDYVIALTREHIAGMSDSQRALLFRDSVLLPLFGKKIIYPNNENGR